MVFRLYAVAGDGCASNDSLSKLTFDFGADAMSAWFGAQSGTLSLSPIRHAQSRLYHLPRKSRS